MGRGLARRVPLLALAAIAALLAGPAQAAAPVEDRLEAPVTGRRGGRLVVGLRSEP